MVQKFNRILENRPIVSVDIRACRRPALAESEVEWPVFCALDEIKAINLELADFNWVDAGPVTTRAKQLN